MNEISSSSSARVGINTSYFLDKLNVDRSRPKRQVAKRQFRSLGNLVEETEENLRTFDEMLDHEVEKVIMNFLEQQGEIAATMLRLRRKQTFLLDSLTTVENIEKLLTEGRTLGANLVNLLTFLFENVSNLKKICMVHDSIYERKLMKVYFGSVHYSSKLILLHNQEGLVVILSTMRKFFEELHEARSVLKGVDINEILYGATDSLIQSQGIIEDENENCTTDGIARVSYLKRIRSASALTALATVESPTSRGKNEVNENLSLLEFDRNKAKLIQLRNMKREKNNQMYFQADAMASGSNSNVTQNNYFSYFGLDGNRGKLEQSEPILREIELCYRRVSDFHQSLAINECLTSYSELAIDSAVHDSQLDISMASVLDISELDESFYNSGSSQYPAEVAIPSFYVTLFLSFLYMANQYIIAPTTGIYAQELGISKMLGGTIIGLSPLAAFVSAILYAIWTNRSFKEPLLWSALFGIFGNLLYSLALPLNSIYCLILGRLVTGLGGPRGIARRYVIDFIPLNNRLTASTHFVTSSALGLACGPLLSALLSFFQVDFTVGSSGIRYESSKSAKSSKALIEYNAVTAPGWLMFILWSFSLFIILRYFTDPHEMKKKAAAEQAPQSNKNGDSEITYKIIGNVLDLSDSEGPEFLNIESNKSNVVQIENDDSENANCFQFLHHIPAETLVLLLFYFVNKVGQEMLISSSPVVLASQFQKTQQFISIFLGIMGLSALPGNFSLTYIAGNMNDYNIMIFMTILSIATALILVFAFIGEQISIIQYIISSIVLFSLLNVTEGVIMSILARLVSSGASVGICNPGLLATEIGTLGRVFGDGVICMISMYSAELNFGFTLYFMYICLLCVVTIILRQYSSKYA